MLHHLWICDPPQETAPTETKKNQHVFDFSTPKLRICQSPRKVKNTLYHLWICCLVSDSGLFETKKNHEISDFLHPELAAMDLPSGRRAQRGGLGLDHGRARTAARPTSEAREVDGVYRVPTATGSPQGLGGLPPRSTSAARRSQGAYDRSLQVT